MIDNTPKKSLGQHWLHDIFALEAVMRAADIEAGDTVLEIGPGLGTLTALLCDTAQSVTAVEFDHDLALQLPKRVKATNLTVVEQDILKFNLVDMPSKYKVVANIPYYLTSKLVRMLLESPNPPVLISLLVQKEVAERLAAGPGELSMLGVSAQFYADVELREIVPAGLFTPPPKVDSQIVRLAVRSEPLFTDISTHDYFTVVRAGFSERRKKLRSSLSGGLRMEKKDVDALLRTAHIPADARAQELTLQQWHDIVLSL